MKFERIKNPKDFLINTALVIGGMATADLGIFFIQEGHRIIDDIVAAPSIPIGFYLAAKGTYNIVGTAVGFNDENNTQPNTQEN